MPRLTPEPEDSLTKAELVRILDEHGVEWTPELIAELERYVIDRLLDAAHSALGGYG